MKKISKNFLALFLSDALSHILGFVATVYIARLLGVGGFGKIGYGMAFLSYALLFGNLGLTTIGAREVAKDHNNLPVIENILGVRISLAMVIFFIFIIGILIIPGDATIKKIIFIYSFSLFPFAVFLEFVFQGREEMEYIGIARFIQYGGYVILLFLLLKNPGGILSVPLLFFVSYILAAVFLIYIFLKKYKTIKLAFSFEKIQSLIMIAIPVGLATLFYQVSLNLPPIILGISHTAEDVGNFSAGYKIIVLLLIIERVFYYLFFPIISRRYVQMPEKLNESFTLCTRLLFALTIPITLGGIALAPCLVKIIYGAGYENVVVIFQILLLYFMITPINTIFGYGLVAIEQEKQFLKIIGITALISFTLIIIGGIVSKGTGVSLGLFLGEFVSIILMKRELSKVVKFEVLRYIIKPVIAALIMAIIIYILRKTNFIYLLGLGIFSYVLIFYLLKGFSKEEFKRFKLIISQK